jgi:hypothetical protein
MSSYAPEIWTQTTFQAQTDPKAVRKRLAEIDDLLRDWVPLKTAVAATSREERVKCLQKLAGACMRYLEEKEAKKQKKDTAFFGKPSARLLNRIDKVKILMGQVFLRLAYERYEYQKNAAGSVHKNLTAARQQLSGLKGSYQHERTDFQTVKARDGLAGTTTAINPVGASFVHKVLDQKDNLSEGAPPTIVALLNKSFDTLTYAEFETLNRHFVGNLNIMGATPNVHFARKEERLRHMMLVPLDGVLRTITGDICNMGWAGYALDSYGNLLVSKANAEWQGGPGGAQFNHSTLAAGRDVICAGEMRIAKGLIKYISNESGHYQPTASQLANAILVLQEEYGLPILGSLEEVVDISSGQKISIKPAEVMAFVARMTFA